MKITQAETKIAAKAVQRKFASLTNSKITLQQAHEVLAAAHGFENWHVMSAKFGAHSKFKYKAGTFTVWLDNATEDGSTLGLPCDYDENIVNMDFNINQEVLDEIIRQAWERKEAKSPGMASFKLNVTHNFLAKGPDDKDFADCILQSGRCVYSQEDLAENMDVRIDVGSEDISEDGTIRCFARFEMFFRHYGMQDIAFGVLVIEPTK